MKTLFLIVFIWKQYNNKLAIVSQCVIFKPYQTATHNTQKENIMLLVLTACTISGLVLGRRLTNFLNLD